MTRYAISDIHGNFKALKQVLARSKFDNNKDTLIVVGDVVDGYSSSFEVVEQLIKIKHLHYLLGNHDVWFMNNLETGWAERIWTSQVGSETISYYKSHGYNYNKMPQNHIDFFNSGKYYLELDNMLFIHGGFDYNLDYGPKKGIMHPKDDTPENIVWDREHLHRCKNDLKIKEWKKVFMGHTATPFELAAPIIMNKDDDELLKKFRVIIKFEDLNIAEWFDKVEAVNEIDSRHQLTDVAYGKLMGLINYPGMIETTAETMPGGNSKNSMDIGGGNKLQIKKPKEQIKEKIKSR